MGSADVRDPLNDLLPLRIHVAVSVVELLVQRLRVSLVLLAESGYSVSGFGDGAHCGWFSSLAKARRSLVAKGFPSLNPTKPLHPRSPLGGDPPPRTLCTRSTQDTSQANRGRVDR